MHRARSTLSLLSLLIFCSLFTLSAGEIFVSPDGPRDGDGSANSPFPTIEKARDHVRTQIPSMSEDIHVVLREGAKPYYLSETMMFTEQDGGKDGHKVVYRNYPGERPVVSGGRRIAGWEKIDGTSPEKWKASLDHPKKIRYLFVDHVPGYRARGEDKISRGDDWGSGGGFPDGFHTDNISLTNAQDVELYKRSGWGDHQFCVERIEDNSIVVMQQPYWTVGKDHADGWAKTGEFIVENAPEHVDKPGEFAYDRQNKVIYYVPRSGQDMNNAKVIANTVEVLFKVKGASPDAQVHNLEFRGIAFHNADYELVEIGDSHGYTTTQASVAFATYVKAGDPAMQYWRGHLHMQSALQILHAREVHVVGCRFEYCGAAGVDAYNDVQNSSIVGNVFRWVGGPAIYVGDIEHGSRDDIFDQPLYPSPPEPQYWVPCKNILVANNLVRKATWDFTHSPGFMVAFTEACEFRHNDVGPVGFNQISMGWGWLNWGNGVCDLSGTARNNRISANRFNAACLHRGDCGHIYTLGHQPGTVIDSNYCFFSGTTIVGNRDRTDWDPTTEIAAFDLSGHGALYPDADSYEITYRDNVYNGGQCLLHTWWGGTDVRKNVLDGGWYSSNGKGVCSGALRIEEDAQAYDPDNAPAECQQIIDNAGLQSDWEHLLEEVDWTPGEAVAARPARPEPAAAARSTAGVLARSDGGLPIVTVGTKAGERITVRVLDTRGRMITSRTVGAGRSGSRTLTPRDYAGGISPSRGVYVVRVSSPSVSGTIRAVVGR